MDTTSIRLQLRRWVVIPLFCFNGHYIYRNGIAGNYKLYVGSNLLHGNCIESIQVSDSNAVMNVHENVDVFYYLAKTIIYIL